MPTDTTLDELDLREELPRDQEAPTSMLPATVASCTMWPCGLR